MQGDHVLGLVHGSTPHSSQLLHVGTDTEQQSEMDTECSDVGSGLAAHPKNAKLPLVVKLVQLALVDGSDTQLSLDGRDEWRALEEGTGEGLESTRKLSLASRELVVQPDDADVLFSGTLLRLDETGSAVNADDETAGNLGIEGSTVARLLDSSDTLAFRSCRRGASVRGP